MGYSEFVTKLWWCTVGERNLVNDGLHFGRHNRDSQLTEHGQILERSAHSLCHIKTNRRTSQNGRIQKASNRSRSGLLDLGAFHKNKTSQTEQKVLISLFTIFCLLTVVYKCSFFIFFFSFFFYLYTCLNERFDIR